MTTTVIGQASTRHYPAKHAIVGTARDYAANALGKWRVPVSVDDARLVVSELVTNAVRVSEPAGQIILHLWWFSTGLVIGVWDCSLEMPTVGAVGDLTLDDIGPASEALEHGDDRAGGWGLPLVEAVAVALQVKHTYSPIGKWVVARLPPCPHGEGRV